MQYLRMILSVALPTVTTLLGLIWFFGRKKITDGSGDDESEKTNTNSATDSESLPLAPLDLHVPLSEPTCTTQVSRDVQSQSSERNGILLQRRENESDQIRDLEKIPITAVESVPKLLTTKMVACNIGDAGDAPVHYERKELHASELAVTPDELKDSEFLHRSHEKEPEFRSSVDSFIQCSVGLSDSSGSFPMEDKQHLLQRNKYLEKGSEDGSLVVDSLDVNNSSAADVELSSSKMDPCKDGTVSLCEENCTVELHKSKEISLLETLSSQVSMDSSMPENENISQSASLLKDSTADGNSTCESLDKLVIPFLANSDKSVIPFLANGGKVVIPFSVNSDKIITEAQGIAQVQHTDIGKADADGFKSSVHSNSIAGSEHALTGQNENVQAGYVSDINSHNSSLDNKETEQVHCALDHISVDFPEIGLNIESKTLHLKSEESSCLNQFGNALTIFDSPYDVKEPQNDLILTDQSNFPVSDSVHKIEPMIVMESQLPSHKSPDKQAFSAEPFSEANTSFSFGRPEKLAHFSLADTIEDHIEAILADEQSSSSKVLMLDGESQNTGEEQVRNPITKSVLSVNFTNVKENQLPEIENSMSQSCGSSVYGTDWNGFHSTKIPLSPIGADALPFLNDASRIHDCGSSCDTNSEASNDSGHGGSVGDNLLSSSAAAGEVLCYEFNFPSELCGQLIGRGGRNIQRIKEQSGAFLTLGNNPFTPDFQICRVQGLRVDVDKALRMIQKKFPRIRIQCINTAVPVQPATAPVIMPDIMQLNLPEGVSVEVVLSAIVNAGHIFLQQPTHPTFPSLEILSMYMNACYNCDQSIPLVPRPIEAGVICAAVSEGSWFRAQIVQVYDDVDECDIKYVDYGGYAHVPNTMLRQIRSDFMTLPFQAVECFMANITPLQDEQYFSDNATAVLDELTTGKLLHGQVIARGDDSTPYVHIYQVSGHSVLLINRELVNREVVRWIEIL